MPFPFEDTYLVGEAFTDRAALRAKFAGDRPADHRGLALGRWVPNRPLTFVRSSGRKPLDYVGTTFAAIRLVSPRVIDLLDREGFTGWSSYPVRLYGKDDETLAGYAGFAIRGRSGVIDDSRSTPGQDVGPGGSVPIWMGLYFDAATWDGSDIFAPESTSYMIVVGKVKRALEEGGITNLGLQRLVDVQRYEAEVEGSRRAYAEWRSRNDES